MENKQLIGKLQECAAACNYCADACLDEDNLQEMINCIRIDRECAAVCEAAAKVLAQDSVNASELLAACEEVCLRCENECRKFEARHCQECADACKECAEACTAYA